MKRTAPAGLCAGEGMLVADMVSDAAREEGFVLRRHHDMLRGGRHSKQDCGYVCNGGFKRG